jgi:cytochrome c oxidase subunit 2
VKATLVQVAAIAVSVSSSGLAQTAGEPEAGRAPYVEVCAGCHGYGAQGNAAVGAPKLTGLQEWYLERQLLNYQQGVRGSAQSDAAGARMAPLALALASARARADVVAYISSLPEHEPTATVEGDAAHGGSLFQLCAACHGARGEGNEALNAPRLQGADDWYIAEQLRAYKQGLRGVASGDLYGRQMLPIMSALADEQAIADVVAYINTLD